MDRDWLGFERGDRKWLGFCVRAENNLGIEWLGFVWVVEIDLFLRAGRKSLGFSVVVEIDCLCVGGRNWFDFSVESRSILNFSVGNRSWLDFSVDPESTWCWYGGRKWLDFSLWIEINSAFVSEHRIRLDIRQGIEIDLISVKGSNLTCFCVGDRNWLGFSASIEID